MRSTMPKISMCSPEIPNMLCLYRFIHSVSICLLGCLLTGTWLADLAFADPIHPSGTTAYQKITGADPEDNRQNWDVMYQRAKGHYVYGKEPADFLKTHIDRLSVGRALDVAMGEGRNAVYLAKKGFRVDGVDFSEVALRKAKLLARENRVSINTIYADLSSYTIKPEVYDVIVNINFLDRGFIAQIKKGLKRGGFVVFENATVDQLKREPGLVRAYLLEKGELKEFFKDFEILVYSESENGKEAVASLVARKPLH